MKLMEKEYKIISELDHANIIKAVSINLAGCYNSKDGKISEIEYTLLEYAPEGDLFFYISHTKGFQDCVIRAIILQIINGISLVMKA